MVQNFARLITMLLVAALAVTAWAQPPQRGGPGGFGPGGGPGGPREARKIAKEFDKNEDGWLNREERVEARKKAVKEAQSATRGRRGGPPGGRRGRGNREPAKPGRDVTPDKVKTYSKEKLYDTSVLRTLFFEFENEDWEKELEDFHGTDVDVPATLTVDGKKYPNVGMRFRGASSYGMVPTGYKRSFNVSVDMADDDQRLYGFKTLNLLNSSGDPSYMSTVLYSHVASQYLPVPKANHVHVVINGQSWGIYVNVQQFNKDFLAEHWKSTKGTRWKASGSPNGDAGLRYLGDEIEPYKERFEMKSNDGKKAWAALAALCKTLNEAPLDKLVSELEPILDIDQTLKFLALDVALVNSDGYWTRASDFSLFRDSDGKFHILPHDMNEGFRSGGGRRGPGGPGGPPRGQGGPPRGLDIFGPDGVFGQPPEGPGQVRPPRDRADQTGRRGGQERTAGNQDRPQDPNAREQRRERGQAGGRGGRFGGRGRGQRGGGVKLDPLISIEDARMPLRSRLLAVPELRKKYLQYVREIAETSLDWKKIEPVISKQAKLIESEVAADTRKLESLEAFQKAVSLETPEEGTEASSLRAFFEQRRKYLLEYQPPVSNKKSDD